jgi:GTP-binding protein
MELLDKAAVTYQVILTKIDKISRMELEKMTRETGEQIKKHAAAYVELIAVSSEKNINLELLRAQIATIAES